MKIAMVVGGFPKLSETFILNQITGLLDLGHDVDIYARRTSDDIAVQPEVYAYGLLGRAHFFNVPSRRGARVGRALRSLLHHGGRHPRLSMRCLRLQRYGSAYGALNNLMHAPPFLDRHYDVFFCQFGGNGVDFAFLKDLFPSSRFVTMFHGDDLSLADEAGPAVFDHLREVGDLYLVNTDFYGGAKLREAGFDPRKVMTLHYGVPVKKIAFRERSCRDRSVRILSVGRLVPKKGHAIAIRAIATLQATNPDLRIEYRIIGHGELKDALEKLIQEVGRHGSIALLGGLPTASVMQWMGEADIFLLPSLMEQAGVVLTEAQASGLPVVATRVGGVPEMVREHRSALLVPPGDPSAMAGALQHLLYRPELWAAMGHEGRRLVEEQHDLETQTLKLAELLRG